MPLSEEIKRKTLIHFADQEMAKRRSEHCLRAYNARERLLEENPRLVEDSEDSEDSGSEFDPSTQAILSHTL